MYDDEWPSSGNGFKLFGSKSIRGKTYQILNPKQIEGCLYVTVKFIGYDRNVFTRHNITNLPKPIPGFQYEDFDYEENEDYDTENDNYYSFIDDISVILRSPTAIELEFEKQKYQKSVP